MPKGNPSALSQLTSEAGQSRGLKIQVPAHLGANCPHSLRCPLPRCRRTSVGGTEGTKGGGESREARGWLVRGTDIPQSLDHRTGLLTPSGHTQLSGLQREAGPLCAAHGVMGANV